MSRRWTIPLAALALLVPVGAVALDRGSSGLGVQASLERCGVAGDTVFCQISASFDRVEGAEFYTATVTRPDSTVQDFGRVATGEAGRASASLWIPYGGNGSYTVEITAWARDGDGEPKALIKESKKSESSAPTALEPDDQGSKEPGSGLETPAELDESALLPQCDAEPDTGLGTDAEAPGGQGESDAQEGGADGGGGPAEGAGEETGQRGDGPGGADEPGADQPAGPATRAAGADGTTECEEPAADANGPCCPKDAPAP